METVGEAAGPVSGGLPREFASLSEFRAAAGTLLGTSSWHTVTQPLIDAFARATDDAERIHLDPRAAAKAQLDGTIAHGLYTLSLGPKFLQEIYVVQGYSRVLNYGYDSVRFLNPVLVESRLRMHARLEGIQPLESGSKFLIEQHFEIEGQGKPACVARGIIAYFD